jgi:hypothetical protein
VHEQHRYALALVEMGQAQPVDLAVMGREGEVRKARERILRCAHRLGHLLRQHIPRRIG